MTSPPLVSVSPSVATQSRPYVRGYKKAGDHGIYPPAPGLSAYPRAGLLPRGSAALRLPRRHPIQCHEVERLILAIDVVIRRQPFRTILVGDLHTFRHADR